MTEQTRTANTEDEQESSSGGEAEATEPSAEQTSGAGEPAEQDSGQQDPEQDSGQQDSGRQESGRQDSGRQESGRQESGQPARRSPNHPQPQPAGSDEKAGEKAPDKGDGKGDGKAPDTSDDTSDAPRGREGRTPINVGEVVWRIAGILATVVRVVGFLLAAIIVVFIVLTFVGVNPANGVAQVVAGVANTAVLGFRDLFLPAEPVMAIVVNFGIAAVFWVLVAEFGSRLIRFVGARLS